MCLSYWKNKAEYDSNIQRSWIFTPPFSPGITGGVILHDWSSQKRVVLRDGNCALGYASVDTNIIIGFWLRAWSLWGFLGGADAKESTCNAGDWILIPVSEDPLENGMASCSSILAWRIPWTEEPGGLQFMGLQRVKRNWESELS